MYFMNLKESTKRGLSLISVCIKESLTFPVQYRQICARVVVQVFRPIVKCENVLDGLHDQV